jgi:hypothetical protein
MHAQRNVHTQTHELGGAFLLIGGFRWLSARGSDPEFLSAHSIHPFTFLSFLVHLRVYGSWITNGLEWGGGGGGCNVFLRRGAPGM